MDGDTTTTDDAVEAMARALKMGGADFPYRRKFTRAEVAVIYARRERLRDAMRDPVGPAGELFYIPPEAVDVFAVHLALAGADVDTERAFIECQELPDEAGMFENRVIWNVKPREVGE
jgi:hypothetical protein